MCKEIIKLALQEDLEPNGDISSLLLDHNNKIVQAQIVAKEDGIMACSHIIESVINEYQSILRKRDLLNGLESKCQMHFKDSEAFKEGEIVCTIEAPALLILGAERTILNFLQRFTSIATATKKLTSLIENYHCQVLDTRKTMPGMRTLEKEAFRAGGGTNHRMNLSDMVMLKENHLAVLGLDLIETINSIRERLDNQGLTKTKIEVEINGDNLYKLDAVLESPVDIIMLDNFSCLEIKKPLEKIRQANNKILVEASGGINSFNIVDYAKTGIDYVSSGSVFTNAKNLDLSMKSI